jgi:hypothetical protein
MAFAPGCLAAVNQYAQEDNLPSYSHDQLKRSTKPTEVCRILGSNITWTHSNLSNKSHLGNNSSPFAYVLSAPTSSNTVQLAQKKHGYNVTEGEFSFPSLTTLVMVVMEFGKSCGKPTDSSTKPWLHMNVQKILLDMGVLSK